MKETLEREELIKLESERIESMKKKVEEFSIQAKTIEKNLEENIDQIIQTKNSIEKNIENMSKEGKNKQNLEIITVEKIAKAHEQLQITKIEIEEAVIEAQDLQSKINKSLLKSDDLE